MREVDEKQEISLLWPNSRVNSRQSFPTLQASIGVGGYIQWFNSLLLAMNRD